MKRNLLLAIAAASLCGCSSTNITKLVGALAKDPAIVSVNVPTMYGTVKFVRVGSQTNSVAITSDGEVRVNAKMP